MGKMKAAELVLEKALSAIKEGTKKHGDTEPSFTMIGQMWGIYVTHTLRAREAESEVSILPHDVAAMMSILKICRSVYAYEFDNYVDDAGYAALACMLNPQTTHGGR